MPSATDLSEIEKRAILRAQLSLYRPKDVTRLMGQVEAYGADACSVEAFGRPVNHLYSVGAKRLEPDWRTRALTLQAWRFRHRRRILPRTWRLEAVPA